MKKRRIQTPPPSSFHTWSSFSSPRHLSHRLVHLLNLHHFLLFSSIISSRLAAPRRAVAPLTSNLLLFFSVLIKDSSTSEQPYSPGSVPWKPPIIHFSFISLTSAFSLFLRSPLGRVWLYSPSVGRFSPPLWVCVFMWGAQVFLSLLDVTSVCWCHFHETWAWLCSFLLSFLTLLHLVLSIFYIFFLHFAFIAFSLFHFPFI